MITAEVIFQYPISGKILLRQLADQEYSDTAIIVESLLYSDGSIELDTYRHNWTINDKPPGKDYYSWQDRCFSAGSVYNPFKVMIEIPSCIRFFVPIVTVSEMFLARRGWQFWSNQRV